MEPVEKKDLIPTPAEEKGGDSTDHQRDAQGESPSETQLLSSNNLEREDKIVASEMVSANNDIEREDKKVPSEMDLLNNDIGKEDKKSPSEMDSLNNDLQREDRGELSSVSRSSRSSDSRREGQGEVPSEVQSSNNRDLQREDQGELSSEMKSLNSEHHREGKGEMQNGLQSSSNSGIQIKHQGELPSEIQSLDKSHENYNQDNGAVEVRLDAHTSEIKELKPEILEKNRSLEEIISEEKEVEPVFDGSEDPEVDATGDSCISSSDLDPEAQGYGWPDKAVAIKNFVREKSVVAVSTVIRRLSGKKDEDEQNNPESEEKNDSLASGLEDEQDVNPDSKLKELSEKPVERSTWNPLNYIKLGRDVDMENNIEQREIVFVENLQPPPLKGRVLLYTRLGCQDCREVRLYLHQRRLRYVEINIDVYPSRKLELEKYCGSSAVPLLFFNDRPIGGLSELKEMEESGKLMEKINDLFTEEPSRDAPVPPLSGEDDESCSGTVDELALIVRKMRESILVKDRFYRMRRFSNCFVGSEAVDFLSEDQYLERKEAIQFARKLASKHFFRHVLEEHVFEDGTHLYRFLDHDPIVLSQCYNIPRGITDVKPKAIIDISSRLRFLILAMFEAYTSVNGRHVDYRSIHGSEEFARYLRVVEELQRVELQEMSREEKLAFFINLYNMMAIHAILMWGYPVGPLERRKMFGDFKYVIGGYTYSLSAIENGILRCNQRPPYNLIKPFGARDQRAKIALPYPEPLIHFALVSGTRSGPAIRCYSPSNIDKELMEAARIFLRDGGVIVDPEAKVASVSKILRWYSADFGKNEMEVLKHAANYLETSKSEELLELLANTQLKVVYQPYDWGVNC